MMILQMMDAMYKNTHQMRVGMTKIISQMLRRAVPWLMRTEPRHRSLCRQSMFTRLLLGKRMLIKMAVMTIMLQLVEKEVMGVPTFLIN